MQEVNITIEVPYEKLIQNKEKIEPKHETVES